MKLIIAEKPSVAQTISKILGISSRKDGYLENNDYIISWCVGHLVGLSEPESYGEEYKKWDRLPIIPSNWNYEIKQNTKNQFNILKKLMNDERVNSIICATDAGREGELIFRHVYNMAKCQKPFERLWISSMEDKSIKDGFENLRESRYYDNLYFSALCRERADWLVGMNFTRLFTTLYNSSGVLSIGRVQTPTLAMVVQRDNDIENFVKEKFFTVEIYCGNFTASSEKIKSKETAENLKNKCRNSKAIVKEIKKEEKKNSPPKLYDLTSLQRDANRLYGFTAKQTLESAQYLYDNKFSTYPRTDSQYLTEDMGETVANIIKLILDKMPFAKDIKLENPNIGILLSNKNVSDHHAIIPTENIKTADLSKLTDTDRKILYLISSRLLTASSDKYVYESTSIKLSCGNTDFKAVGKIVNSKGFKMIEEKFKTFMKCGEEEKLSKEENSLPEISENQEFNITPNVSEHWTSPPKSYTEDTLLLAMEKAGNEDYNTEEIERKGLGTPATRAAIIETLISRGYIERKKKQISATEKGKNIIKIVPEKIKSAKMTAEWENKLVLIGKGEFDETEFINEITEYVKDIIKKTAVVDKMAAVFNEREIIGKCPRCKSDIVESKANFYCINKNCDFILWKKNKFFETKKKEITKAVAKSLLENGRVHYKDLYSPNKGKTYEADILLDDTGGKYVNFKLEFKKEGSK